MIPNLGAVGAAVGTLVAEMVVCVYQALKIRDYIKIKKYVLRSIPFIISGMIMFLIVFNMNIAISNNFVKLLTEIAIGMSIYAISIVLQIGVAYKIFRINWFQ